MKYKIYIKLILEFKNSFGKYHPVFLKILLKKNLGPPCKDHDIPITSYVLIQSKISIEYF